MRLAFFGSGEFGIPTLAALEKRHDVLVVVTQPPRPAGRGGKTRLTPIHERALRNGLRVLCPPKPNTTEFEAELRNIAPELAVVVAYGHLIRKPILSIPAMGYVNLHASLLPAYRGAAPVPRAIMAGETTSGVSIFQLDENFDTGAVIARAELPIAGDDTSATYLAKLAPVGAELMLRALEDIAKGSAVPSPQDDARASRAPKLHKEEGCIDWELSFCEIERTVRAFQPWPHAFALLPTAKGLLRVNVIRVEPADMSAASAKPGAILAADPKTGLVIMTGDCPARLSMLQPEGKRPMPDKDFLRGHRILP